MQAFVVLPLRNAGVAALLLHCAAQVHAAASPSPSEPGRLAGPALHSGAMAEDAVSPPVQAQLAHLQRQIEEQRMVIEALARELSAQRAAALRLPYGPDEPALQSPPSPGLPPDLPEVHAFAPHALASQDLAGQRGAGAMPAFAAPAANPAAGAAVPASSPEHRAQGSAGRPAAGPNGPAAPAVGKAPSRDSRPPEVAPLFEQPGILTPRGKFVFEPALQFGYSSSNRVALVGYTVIPALLIGLVDVREVKRNTATAVAGMRMGLTRRLEIDLKLPYVYRSDATVSREIFTGTAVENVFSTSGKAIGDAELGLRYQLNRGGPDKPFYVASLRYKSRTGRDPFSVVTDCTRRCIGLNATGTGLPLELPTGSGFHSLQPGLTWLFPSDPAVFFGSISYLHNLKRSQVSRTVLGGEKEWLGEVEPGDIAGFNFGLGLGLNDKASLSLGYDHSSIGRTRQEGRVVPGSVRTQLGTLVLGYSYRISERRSLNVSVGAGLTRDTPDVSLTVRMPTSF